MADIIDEVITNEGGNRATNDPNDTGGRTQFGISELVHPEAWLDNTVTLEEAKSIYEHDYVNKPGFNLIEFEPLRNQLIDFGVNAGPRVPTVALQHILGVTRDGHLGQDTLSALALRNPVEVNNFLVAHRELFYRTLARTKPRDKKFLKGWLARAHRFLIETSTHSDAPRPPRA